MGAVNYQLSHNICANIKYCLPRLGFCRLRMRHKNKTRITIRRNPPTPAMTAIISSLLKVLLDLSPDT